MPKIVTEEEQRLVREAIHNATLLLLREKGIRKITVDDITAAVGISKGAFYTYYPSKEIGLYEVLRRNESELFSRMESIMAEGTRDKERIERFLHEVYLAPDSIVLHLPPTELEVLLRKLPPEYRERARRKSDDYFHRSLQLLKVEENKMEALALLLDSLGYAAADRTYSKAGRHQALNILVTAIAEYLLRGDAV